MTALLSGYLYLIIEISFFLSLPLSRYHTHTHILYLTLTHPLSLSLSHSLSLSLSPCSYIFVCLSLSLCLILPNPFTVFFLTQFIRTAHQYPPPCAVHSSLYPTCFLSLSVCLSISQSFSLPLSLRSPSHF